MHAFNVMFKDNFLPRKRHSKSKVGENLYISYKK